MAKKTKSKMTKEEDKKFHIELAKQMLTLATAAFGLVAALAWNQFIQEFVSTYIKKWFPVGGKLVSMGLYAIIVTILAVLVTYELSKLVKKLEDKN
jgi:hypothetical protein